MNVNEQKVANITISKTKMAKRFGELNPYILSFYLDYPTPTTPCRLSGTWEYMRKHCAVELDGNSLFNLIRPES
jgi:hypothetical protein